MGETPLELFSDADNVIRPTFNRSILVEARQERLTDDAGALLGREVMDRIYLIEWLKKRLFDPRDKTLITHPLSEELRMYLLLLMQGWTDADDADFLRDDPAFRMSVSNRKQDAPLRSPQSARQPDGLPSQPTLSRFLESLTYKNNPAVLQEANLFCAQQRCILTAGRKRYESLTLDMDSLPITVHGHQDGALYNGYYRQVCYHPLVFGSADIDALFGAILRPGNVNTSQGAAARVETYLDWAQTYLSDDVSLRGDAGFPDNDLLCKLEARHTPYVFCFTKYAPLAKMAQPDVSVYQKDWLQQPEQLREEEFRCIEMQYQAEDWAKPRRIVLVIVPPAEGELPIPHFFFLITNYSPLTMSGPLLVDHYRGRGSYEDMLGQFKSTLLPQRSSTTRPKSHYRGKQPKQHEDSRDAFATNQALLSLNVIAFNLMGLIEKLHEQAHKKPGRPKVYGRSSTRITRSTVRQYYMKAPAHIILHARRVYFSVAQPMAHLWQCLWTYLDRLGFAPAPS